MLGVLAVVLALGGSDDKEELQSADTSLRAQQQSDFTLDDMMQSQTGKPEYENFTDEVYRERAQGIYTEDPEVLALQQGVSPTFTTNVTLRLYFHRNIHKLNL